jgi:hypothetical protein
MLFGTGGDGTAIGAGYIAWVEWHGCCVGHGGAGSQDVGMGMDMDGWARLYIPPS